VAGAFGKLQEEANGGHVRKIEGRQIVESGTVVARQEFGRKRGDLCRREKGIAVAWLNTEFFRCAW
jgi:hypothetical protein